MTAKISKSIRLAPEALQEVEAWPVGGNFSERLEDLILSAPRKRTELKQLTDRTKQRRKELAAIEERIRKLENMEFSLKSLKSQILSVQNQAKDLLKVPNEPEKPMAGQINLVDD